ncbi:MAG: chromate efflux transporter [Solirubrobacteraceae bacterium]
MRRTVPVRTVVREWARLGALSFGGPPAQVALLRELTVERRRWIDAREFEDANAATQLIPGPGSTQLAIYCAHRIAGTAGAVAGGLAFILPGLLLILAISAVALSDSPPTWVEGIGAGAAAAVVAVVVRVGVDFARASLAGRRGGAWARTVVYLAVGAAAAIFAGAALVLALLACGLVELAWRRRSRAAVHAWPLALVLGATGAAALPPLAWTAFKVGALSYGGGLVIIPLMQADAVDTYGWMTRSEFADAVAFGQLTPGPVVQTVAMVGWAAAGLPGALLASVVAFAPSFLVVALTGERFERLRGSGSARAFLDGAGPAAAGAILGVAVPLLAALEVGWQYAVLGGAAVLVLRLSPVWALVGGAVAGLVAALTGMAVP